MCSTAIPFLCSLSFFIFDTIIAKQVILKKKIGNAY